jgi:hypothetical protein
VKVQEHAGGETHVEPAPGHEADARNHLPPKDDGGNTRCHGEHHAVEEWRIPTEGRVGVGGDEVLDDTPCPPCRVDELLRDSSKPTQADEQLGHDNPRRQADEAFGQESSSVRRLCSEVVRAR